MTSIKVPFLLLFLLFFQTALPNFDKLEIRVDTNTILWPDDAIVVNKQKVLPVPYTTNEVICEISIWPQSAKQKISLVHTNDYTIIDSLLWTGEQYRYKILINKLTQRDFLKLSYIIGHDSIRQLVDIPLQPVTQTRASIYVRDDELFIGEEKVFEIICNNNKNLVFTNEWIQSPQIDYRIEQQKGKTYLHLVPNKLGRVILNIPLSVRKPFIENNTLIYQLPAIQQAFFIKASRLQFLNISPKEFTLTGNTRIEGVEVQLSYNRLLKMKKTYRIEDQEEPGGPLIAELFTKQHLANDQVLCILRPYNYHHKSDGYLYIKDADDARFITNFGISHATTIEKISVLRDGGNWKPGNTLYPGETVEVMLEGKSLHKAKFRFEDLIDLTNDSLSYSENRSVFKLKVPVDIGKRKLTIYNHAQPSGHTLTISEYQTPREFDFLYLNYGDLGRKVDGIRAPILYNKVIKDVAVSLNPQVIDSKDKLYGKQYIDIDIRITGKRNELIEMRSVEDVVVCPGDRSPRSEVYDTRDCTTEDISLNRYLNRKTYDLDEWSKISMTFKHDKNKYDGEGYQKEVDLILKRTFSFDIEVSFPAGLITISKQDNDTIGFGSLSGISMAMIAQFSFYHPEKIAQYRPYKIGAGFLAFNAFNFNENAANRDVGIVLLGSVYPTKRDHKLAFPLYVGGGYFLKAQKWFFLIGPGIRVRL